MLAVLLALDVAVRYRPAVDGDSTAPQLRYAGIEASDAQITGSISISPMLIELVGCVNGTWDLMQADASIKTRPIG